MQYTQKRANTAKSSGHGSNCEVLSFAECYPRIERADGAKLSTRCNMCHKSYTQKVSFDEQNHFPDIQRATRLP